MGPESGDRQAAGRPVTGHKLFNEVRGVSAGALQLSISTEACHLSTIGQRRGTDDNQERITYLLQLAADQEED